MNKPIKYWDLLKPNSKRSQSKLGAKNPRWKGEQVGYTGLHRWVHRRLSRPNLCEICKQNYALDLANITGKYTRDLKNWKWLCRKCHMQMDGRLKPFLDSKIQKERNKIANKIRWQK